MSDEAGPACAPAISGRAADGPEVATGARRVVRNSFFLLLSRASNVVFMILTFSLTARYLGSEQFGLLVVVTSIAMMLRPLADFGFESILCREIARSTDRAVEFVGTTVNVRMVFSLVIIAASYVYVAASDWPQEASLAILLSIVTELAVSMTITYLAVIRAFEHMEWELVTHFIHKTLLLAGLAAVIYFDLGFLAIFYARLIPAAMFLGSAAFVLYGRYVGFSLAYSWDVTKFIMKESYPIAIFTFLLTLIFRIDVFILQWLRGAGEVAIFEVPNRLITQIQIFAVSVSLSLFPALSRSARNISESPLEEYYRNTYKILFFAGSFAAGMLFIGSSPLIRLLVGREFGGSSMALKILAPTTPVLFVISLQNVLFTAIGRQTLNMVTVALALALNAALDIILIPSYSYIGASVATLTAYVVFLGLNEYFIERHNIKPRIWGQIARMTACGVLMCVAVLVKVDGDLATLVARFAVGGLIFAASAYVLKAVTKEEARLMLGLFTKRRRRGPGGPPGPVGAGK